MCDVHEAGLQPVLTTVYIALRRLDGIYNAGAFLKRFIR